MSHFSQTLSNILAPGGRKQHGAAAELARKAGIDPGALSRYLHGTARPSDVDLERLCLPLAIGLRAELMAAFLRDLLPATALELVRIESFLDCGNPPASSAFAELPKKTRLALEFIAKEAKNRPEVAAMILSFGAIVEAKGAA